MTEREKTQQDTHENLPDEQQGSGSLPVEPVTSPLLEHSEGEHEPTGHALILPPGASRVTLRLEVPEDTHLTLKVEARTPEGKLLGRQFLVVGEGVTAHSARQARNTVGLGARLRWLVGLAPAWLAGLSFGLYILVRLVNLPAFPIYFFTDEAVQTVRAADLLRNHFSSADGEFLPAFFENGSQYNLSTSVYLQALPYFLFGKSIWVTRGTAALMTLLAAASVYLILKRVFQSPNPWLAVLILSATPTWFLHSRTAFETALASSFYAAFMYCYLMYRSENPRYLYPAVTFGALAFYTYSPMRMIMAVTALLLFVSDVQHHWKNRKTVLYGLGLAALLALPFARFLLNHPDAAEHQMRLLGSYWLYDIPLLEKLDTFAGEYLHGLDPLYWYLPNSWDLPRHIMLNYGHLLRQTLPLGLLGVFLALRNIRQPAYRALLIALLAVPSGTALVRLGQTRVLVMVIPMAMLTALAAQAVIDWLHDRWRYTRSLFQSRPLLRLVLPLVMFFVLAGANLYMLSDSLVNGPRWFKDYGLTGMQYGARQVFGEIAEILRSQPATRLILSPSWANGTDVIARFFFPDPLPFQLGSPVGFYEKALPLDNNTLVVMIPEEFVRIPSTRFSEVKVEKTLPYPDGRPGFYFVRLKYVDDIETVIKAESDEHLRLLSATFLVDGEEVDVTYPRMDINAVQQLFDHDLSSLARTAGINPMELTFDYRKPRQVSSIVLRVGGTATTVIIRLWLEGKLEPVEMTKSVPQDIATRDISFEIPQPLKIDRLWVSVKNTDDQPDGFVHLWEITVR